MKITGKVYGALWHPQYNPKPTKLQRATQVRNELLCKTKGHHIVDCSSAGPDSGDMDCYCSRCGQYWDIPLY